MSGLEVTSLEGYAKATPYLKKTCVGTDCCCSGAGTNCTIKSRPTPTESDVIGFVFDAIETQDNSIIAQVFSEKRNTLIPILGMYVVENVINGKLKVTDGKSSIPGNRFIYLGNEAKTYEMAYSFEYP